MIITEVKLEGLSCLACQKVVEKRLKNISAVEVVLVNLETGQVKITGSRIIDRDEIIKVLEGTQYKLV